MRETLYTRIDLVKLFYNGILIFYGAPESGSGEGAKFKVLRCLIGTGFLRWAYHHRFALP